MNSSIKVVICLTIVLSYSISIKIEASIKRNSTENFTIIDIKYLSEHFSGNNSFDTVVHEVKYKLIRIRYYSLTGPDLPNCLEKLHNSSVLALFD